MGHSSIRKTTQRLVSGLLSLHSSRCGVGSVKIISKNSFYQRLQTGFESAHTAPEGNAVHAADQAKQCRALKLAHMQEMHRRALNGRQYAAGPGARMPAARVASRVRPGARADAEMVGDLVDGWHRQGGVPPRSPASIASHRRSEDMARRTSTRAKIPLALSRPCTWAGWRADCP